VHDGTSGVDIPHHGHLLRLLVQVGLVHAYGIRAECEGLVWVSDMAEEVEEVRRNLYFLVVYFDRYRLVGVTPYIRGACKSSSRICEILHAYCGCYAVSDRRVEM